MSYGKPSGLSRRNHTDDQFDFMTHTERPALRSTEGSFAGEENESHSVVVKVVVIIVVIVVAPAAMSTGSATVCKTLNVLMCEPSNTNIKNFIHLAACGLRVLLFCL